MEPDDVVDQLVNLVDSHKTARSAVAQLEADEIMAVSADLKERALYYLPRDAPRALAIAELILNIGGWQDTPRIRALGLQTKAIALTLSQREFDTALDLFAESEAIYRSYDDELEIAIGQVSRIWALASLQRYDEAFATGEWAKIILTRHNAYRRLAALGNNLAAIYGRRGQDQEALERFTEVEIAYSRLGEEGQRRLPFALINKAIVLRNLGRFNESITANETGLQMATKFSQTAIVARAEQNLGITYFLLGRISKAQILLQKARDTFITDQRYRDAILVELFLSDGLLYIRQYEAVLAKCRQVRETFQEAGTQFEVAQAFLNEATALTGLHAYEEALKSLVKARQIFTQEGNETWQAYTDLEEAAILYRRQKYKTSAQLAAKCSKRFQVLKLPLKEALALVITARSTLASGGMTKSHDLIEQALDIAESIDVPDLTYQAYYLKGKLAIAQGDRLKALVAYDTAIKELERLQSQIMVEFRADFLADKDEVYAHAVDLCLEAENPKVALTFAERAKSRSLLSMLGHHVELRIEARNPADQALVDQILTLRETRDRLYRRWETGETPGSTVNREEEQVGGQEARHEARQVILQTEDEIRTLWHNLLVQNTAYARDASLWQAQTRLEQEALGKDALLVEFFALPQGLVAFLISATEIKAIRLPVTMKSIGRHHRKLQHNFNKLKQAPYLAASFTHNAQLVLNNLYLALVAPWIEIANEFRRLIIVPHGPLHYLPFHAFFDGQEYLLQRFQMSYLPGSSFLGLKQTAPSRPLRSLVMGHTQGGRLFHIADEVEAVASAFNSQPYVDEEATRYRFQEEAPSCHVIHIAAHGDYRPSNPLFSGLYLEDSLLTTLDVFNLPLSASLVTLSACQTGRNVVRGGDELFGLTRAFLTSGAASLILSLWPVEDKTTTNLMTMLYNNLVTGQDKVAALQHAQTMLIEGNEGSPAAHPYYWAPFLLVGDTGPLLS